MKILFNTAQLLRVQQESLKEILNVLQSENGDEIEVSAFEFPNKLSVKVDKGLMILVWDPEKKSYAGLTEPEPEPELEKLGVGAMVELPQSEPDPMELARLKYKLMSTHLNMPDEKKIIFAKEYARLWSEHR